MKKIIWLSLFVFVAALYATGCGKKEEEKKAPSPHETGEIPIPAPKQPVMKGPAEVRIPEAVKASWKAIVVEIANSETGKTDKVQIDIGETKNLEEKGLKIKAISFLPAFQMDGPVVTSRSNEVENPAAQIEVYAGEDTPWKGWLFVLYPTTHAFTHPKYSIKLLEGVAAEEG